MDHQVATIAAACLNCGAALDGPFCSRCGQKAVHPKPSLHELLHDALEEFLHFDGKIVQTVRTLLTRPGQLTVDIVAGRRARYIAPLRLYLTCSVIYFVIAAAAPGRDLQISVTTKGSETIEEAIDKASPWIRPLMKRAAEDPGGLQRDVFAAWPKGLFVLLPVFATIVALFYRRRHFVEHMYFALHLHAFAFIAMTVPALFRFAHMRWLSVVVGVAVIVWIPVYVHLAFRRVYGQTHVRTFMKEAGIGFLYGVASIPAIFVAALWVASHHH